MTPLENIISTLKQNKTYLHDKYGVSEIDVFGSYKRNDFTENSDVDLLVDFDRPIGLAFVSLADELEKILCKKVDLLTKRGINKHYRPYVEKDLRYV